MRVFVPVVIAHDGFHVEANAGDFVVGAVTISLCPIDIFPVAIDKASGFHARQKLRTVLYSKLVILEIKNKDRFRGIASNVTYDF